MALHTSLLHRLDALNLVTWKIYSFELPYVAGGVRKGLLIHVKNGDGDEKWAEVAPLPGRSSETLETAQEQVIALFSGKQVDEIVPSVQFCLESLLAPPFEAVTARLYALLSGTPDEVLSQAEVAQDLGYGTVKVKVSSFSIEDAQRVLNTLKKSFRLRVDCNNKFTLDHAIALFAPFDPTLFDCVEDPTFEIARLSEFTHPFAIDENVAQFHTFGLTDLSKLYGFILKPTLLGGRKGCTPLMDFAKKHKLKCVFSPSFESGIGLLQILSLAKQFNHLDDLIGLDTSRHLGYDLLNPAINFSTPKLTVVHPPRVNTELLTEIAHGTGSLPHL